VSGQECTTCQGDGVIDHGDRYVPGVGLQVHVTTCEDCDGSGHTAVAS